MPVLPDTKITQLQYFEAHYPIWLTNFAGIGLTSAQATDIKTKTLAARTSYNAMIAARTAAKNATQAWYDAYNQMAGSGRDDIRLIKAFADSQTNPMTVYTLAQVEPPAPPGPAPIPGTPTDFRVEINPATGDLTLKWKCVGDGNAIYLISRQTGTGAMTFLGGVGAKSFTDTTLPSTAVSAGGVNYFVTCQRGATAGQAASITVRFGSGGGGGLVMVTENTPVGEMKIAA